ncbi:hypothetical protein [Halapricum sp. CBA1109]|uniref:hypothetical protein n=1 Tax=Halapricum sp. CBA1109 TaxID=2668068 RepID=UPI001E569CAF|nr:hypothetical protein [Halapricum sp. CBA1109]
MQSREAIYHEYGHALHMTTLEYDLDKSPSGGRSFGSEDSCHYYNTESSVEFALREGWAEFFAAVMVDSRWDDQATYYNQTMPRNCPPVTEDDGTMDGYRVEGAIAGALYDVVDDTPNEDPMNESFATVYSAFDEEMPQSAFEVYDALAERVDNETALQQVFTTHGIDVAEPALTVDGGPNHSSYGNETTITGTAVDEHSNITRVQASVDGGPWSTVAGDDATEWSVTVEGPTDTVTIRATDHWGNNATRNVTVEQSAVPSVVGGRPITDPDGDGVYEDVDGDGEADLFDALVYYNNRNSGVIEAHPGLFDYDSEDDVGTLFDALALFEMIGAPNR